MKTKQNLSIDVKKIALHLLLISSLAMVSCTSKILPTNSKAENRTRYMQSFNRSMYGTQTTLSPYTKEYKAYLQKKYFGKRIQKKGNLKNDSVSSSTSYPQFNVLDIP